MKLKKLLKDIPDLQMRGSKEIEITGLCNNSKCVSPGNLFIAKRGMNTDGGKYIAEAVSAGASAILTDIFDPFLENVVQIIHPRAALIEGQLAATYYDHADRTLSLMGITGTSGKTTCAFLARHLLNALYFPCGLIGTIEWDVGKQILPASYTTPDLLTNHKLFYEMVQNGCKSAVMEVSSHALDQGRVLNLSFDVGIFTNLTLDHLDYHKTMEAYGEAKAKLFASLKKRAILNRDSSAFLQMAAACSCPVLTYGLSEEADLYATDIQLNPRGFQCHISYQGEKHPFSSQLIGRFNVYNCLAIIALGLTHGAPLPTILQILNTFPNVPGRLQRVSNALGIEIFVDYSHKDDALKNVLEALNELKKGRIITIFGCGGDRDRSKRPKMGEVAERLSDFVIITSDNPRSEEPDAIIKEILTGIKEHKQLLVETDREEAIRLGIQMARPGDIVLIAGKGHETYQVFAHRTIDFDDRVVAQRCAALDQKDF